MQYILSYQKFILLSSVEGFNDINGHTYQEHVANSWKLEDSIRNEILASNHTDVIDVLKKYNIEFMLIE